MAQISITPKIGFEYVGISYYPKSTIKKSDIKITIPDGEGFLSVELNTIHKKKKYSLVVEMKNQGEGVKILIDSFFTSNGGIGDNKVRLLTGRTHTFVGLFYDRVNNFFPSSSILSYFYGAGIGIGFNRTDAYFRETQDAGYSSAYGGGENFYNIERRSKPTGHGIFLKLRGGLALHNKKGREAVILEVYWNQGFRKMLEHTVDYSYGYRPRPGSGNTVTGYRFNSRGTTFGGTLGFPVYFFKNKKAKK